MSRSEDTARGGPLPGSAVYHGYVIVPESCIDGWCLGTISDLEEPGGDESGDAFVVAPDGRSASLVWDVGDSTLTEILPPDADRWGVYSVSFPEPMRSVADLVAAFHGLLPELRALHA
ncbi:hypothetical protein EON77_06065, partial [bacterium]